MIIYTHCSCKSSILPAIVAVILAPSIVHKLTYRAGFNIVFRDSKRKRNEFNILFPFIKTKTEKQNEFNISFRFIKMKTVK